MSTFESAGQLRFPFEFDFAEILLHLSDSCGCAEIKPTVFMNDNPKIMKTASLFEDEFNEAPVPANGGAQIWGTEFQFASMINLFLLDSDYTDQLFAPFDDMSDNTMNGLEFALPLSDIISVEFLLPTSDLFFPQTSDKHFTIEYR